MNKRNIEIPDWVVNELVKRMSFLEHQLKKRTEILRSYEKDFEPSKEELEEDLVTQELAKVGIKILRGNM